MIPFLLTIGVVTFIIGLGIVLAFWADASQATREEEKVADFFEPVEYPTMEALQSRRMAREYSERIMMEEQKE